MTLRELRIALAYIIDDPAVSADSPVIVEGWNEDGDVVQGSIESVTTEARCEADDEHQAVYLNLIDEAECDEEAAQSSTAAGPKCGS